MKFNVLCLLLWLNGLLYAQLVDVTVNITNGTQSKFTEGVLTVDGDQHFVFTKEGKHVIQLSKGKHDYSFNAVKLQSVIRRPDKIKDKNNEINIFLFDPNDVLYPVLITKDHQPAEIDSLYKQEKLAFLIYGLGARLDDQMRDFTRKYKIKFSIQGCMVHNTENNQLIAAFLDEEFGTAWRKDLEFLPMGVAEIK